MNQAYLAFTTLVVVAACTPLQQQQARAQFCVVQMALPVGTGAAIGGIAGGAAGGVGGIAGGMVGTIVQASLNGLCPAGTIPAVPIAAPSTPTAQTPSLQIVPMPPATAPALLPAK